MTPQQYFKQQNFRPLTIEEIHTGKNELTYYGTKDLLPWEEIYTRIRAGQPMGDISKIYGNGRRICVWAMQDGIEQVDEVEQVVVREIEQRRTMQAIADENPEVARTLKEMVNEYAPDVTKLAATLSHNILTQANNIAERPTATSLDLVNLANAQQKTLDTLGISQRHAQSASQTTNHFQIEGFTFIPAVRPPDDIIEVTAQ